MSTCALLLFASCSTAQTLSVGFGSKGVQTLSYGATPLEDVGAQPSDAFHIWHMLCTDLQGNRISDVRCGWGEQNLGEVWDASTHTETYTFSWGSVATQFVQNGNNLDMVVTEVDNADSGVILDGAEIYPFVLHFPQEPAGFYGYTQYGITTTGPAVLAADYGSGVVTAVVPNEALALYDGWKNQGAQAYSPIMAGTAPDGLATFLPSINSPVQPGQSFTYTVSLRFTPEGTAAAASDAYSSYASTYPNQMTWKDRRVLGTAYLASSPTYTGDASQPGGFPSNPRRYFNDASVNVTTIAGLQAFQSRMLAQAAANVTNAQAMNAQGVITWDIEGEQYSQSTSYVCSPDQIAAIAPEMESIVSNPASAYYGRKLDDAYFATMTSAGLKAGVCIRPQVFTMAAGGTASQVYLTDDNAIAANLESKAKYANARWDVTVFYVDSSVYSNGGTLNPAIFQQLITDLPGFLFIPEESTPRYYAYSAPFYTFLFHGDLGTPAAIRDAYPEAFGANLINDVSPATLTTYLPQLTKSVVGGDILMGLADFWQANDPTLVAIYRAAGVTTSPPVNRTAPQLSWSAPAGMIYGVPLSATQLDAKANVAGTFVYSSALGTILPAGNNVLTATFTPTDTTHYTTATASVNLFVAQATPAITWPAPASIAYGAALSASQLNASSTVSGTFAYSPGASSVVNVGMSHLTAVFTPADTTDYTAATATVSLTVTPAVPVISWPAPASIASGTPLSGLQLDATANVPGTFVYTPAAGTVLNAGTQLLQVVFTPTDPAHYTAQAATVSLAVTAPANTSSALAILFPLTQSRVSGVIDVVGRCTLPLDSAGSYLMVDGQEVGTHRTTSAPFVYPLDTSSLTNGTHVLQLWAHDIGNNVTLSVPITIRVVHL